LTNLYQFTGNADGGEPSGIVQGRDGSLYGAASGGGRYESGTLFKISATGEFTRLYSFTGGNDGSNPQSGLIQGTDGNFYGTASYGGLPAGTVFKITAAGVFTILHAFDDYTDPAQGENPNALLQGADGNFYGATSSGGANGWGTVFSMDANGALSTIYSFNGGADGGFPAGGLYQGSDGYLYGTTFSGGDNGQGVVFKISVDGAYTSLYSFQGGDDGGTPLGAALVQGSDGFYYGTTLGGTNNAGAIFKIDSDGDFSVVYDFKGGADGGDPGGLSRGGDGNFYGVTSEAGAGSHGTVYQLGANGAFTTLYSFSGGPDGAYPYARLTQGSNGYFYGTTSGGGTGNDGTIFKISASGAFASLYSFTYGADGVYPSAGLVQGDNGYFYGTTDYGGTGESGTMFEIDGGGTLTTLYTFAASTTGFSSKSGLIQGADGYFYGTSMRGGLSAVFGHGYIFRLGASGSFTNLHNFSTTDGFAPEGGLIQGGDGYFYGTTSLGGARGFGTVFRISSNGAFTILHNFAGGAEGEAPSAGLVQGSDGYFYGATQEGGTNNAGTIFQISAGGAFTNLYTFTGGLDGNHPSSGLILGADGNLYGATFGGGTYGGGTIFQLSLGTGNPKIETADGSFGPGRNGFGFNVDGQPGSTVVVEWSPNLSGAPAWTPLWTNILAGGAAYFSDPNWRNNSTGFYRARVQ
jgi:uncharacterized repeat protein (TIGR03803 family)